MVSATYTVKGMSCEHCARSVTEELTEVEGVAGVSVDLDSGHVTVDSDDALDVERVRAAVDEAGYELVL